MRINSFRIFIFTLLLTIFATSSLFFWAVKWVDERGFSEIRSVREVNFFRGVYRLTPSLSDEEFSLRTRKLSWLSVQAEIFNIKGDGARTQAINIFRREFESLSDHYRKYNSSLSARENIELLTQLLIYLNRVTLFDEHFEPDLASALDEFYEKAGGKNFPDIRGRWMREKMMNAFLSGTVDQQKFSRKSYEAMITDPNKDYRLSELEFLNGLLFCTKGRGAEAENYLRASRKSFTNEFFERFISVDFNIFIVSAASDEKTVCQPILSSIIKGI